MGVRASIFTGTALLLSAPSPRARLSAAIYAVSVAALFGSSALHHRVAWRSPGAYRWVRRLDHSMIFVVIAGTYTRFALLALRGALRQRHPDRSYGQAPPPASSSSWHGSTRRSGWSRSFTRCWDGSGRRRLPT